MVWSVILTSFLLFWVQHWYSWIESREPWQLWRSAGLTAALKVECLFFMFWFLTKQSASRCHENCSHWDEMREISKYQGRPSSSSSTVPALTINWVLQTDRLLYITEFCPADQLLDRAGTFDCSLSRWRDVWLTASGQVPLSISLSACLDTTRQWSGPFITAALTSWLFYCSISFRIIVMVGRARH